MDDKQITFGVSGMLQNSTAVFYDHQTQSLWSQLTMEAIKGPMKGKKLKLLPVIQTTWEAWKKEHPDTLVLSTDTGFLRRYDSDPYKRYRASKRLISPVASRSPLLPDFEFVLGVEVDGLYRAYPFSLLEELASPVEDEIKGMTLKIYFDKDAGSAFVRDEKNELYPSIASFWFAWYVFHPDTTVFQKEAQ